MREIQFDQNKLVGNVFLELLMPEHFLIQADAPATPVGAGEVHQQILAFLLGLRFGQFKVLHPVFSRR